MIKCLVVKAMNIQEINVITLAYLGDAVYELHIRNYLVQKGIAKVKDLQNESVKYVSATSQVRILNKLIENNILTEEELEIVNRGRNASSHRSKTTDIFTYKKSTGFECLIGYLYKNDIERCNYLLNYITGNEL